MATKKSIAKRRSPISHPLIGPEERLAVWRSVQGMWKNRKPDPVKELKKMRKEWDRKLPPLFGHKQSKVK